MYGCAGSGSGAGSGSVGDGVGVGVVDAGGSICGGVAVTVMVLGDGMAVGECSEDAKNTVADSPTKMTASNTIRTGCIRGLNS